MAIDQNKITEFLLKDGNWKFFAGLTLSFFSFMAKQLYFLIFGNKVKLAFSIESNNLNLLNLSKEQPIEVNMVVAEIFDITAPKEYFHASQFFGKAGFVIKPSDKNSLFALNDQIIISLKEFLAPDIAAFKTQYPQYLFPVALGVNFYIHYSKVNAKTQKKIDYNCILSGSFEQGLHLSKDPWYFDKNKPVVLIAKDKLAFLFHWILHPAKSWNKRRADKILSIILKVDSALKAYTRQKLSKSELLKKLEKLLRNPPDNLPQRMQEQIEILKRLKESQKSNS